MTNKRVFIYARRSNQKRKDRSISIIKQINKIENKCEEKGLIIEGIYKDNQSGFKAGIRKDFNKMLNELKERNIKGKGNKIDYIYVYRVSRLCRNTEESRIIEDYVRTEKVKILSINEWYPDGVSGQFSLIKDMNDAIEDSLKKSEQSRIDMDLTYREKGKISRKLSYGYILGGRQNFDVLVNNEFDEANIVKKVFNEYATGNYTYKELAKHLNILGFQKYFYSPKNKKMNSRAFNAKDIENILCNRIYYGKIAVVYKDLTETVVKHFREAYPDIEIINNSVEIDYTKYIKDLGDYEHLITEELFNRAKNIRNGKRGKNKDINSDDMNDIHIFKGVLKCDCKKNIEKDIYKYLSFTGGITPKPSGVKYYNYRCSNNNRGSSNRGGDIICNNQPIAEKALEKLIIKDFISGITFSKTELKIFEDIIYKKLKDLGEIKENQGRKLQLILNRLYKEQKKSLEAYRNEDDEMLKPLFKEELKNILSEIKEIEEQKALLPTITNDKEQYVKEYLKYINVIGTDFINFPRYKKQKIIKAIFKYIIVKNKKIVNFKLNPIFELAFMKKKVVTYSNSTSNSEKQCYNSQDGSIKTKKAQSKDCTLYGSLTRNRT